MTSDLESAKAKCKNALAVLMVFWRAEEVKLDDILPSVSLVEAKMFMGYALELMCFPISHENRKASQTTKEPVHDKKK